MAAKTMSVEEMEQLLVKLQREPDGKVARQIADVELTQRVSQARLARWEADFPGKRAHEALMKLADMSAFLDPPGTDVAPGPPPDIDMQRQILMAAIQYVKTTMSRLPDFYATRETTSFDSALSESPGYSMESAVGGQIRGVDVPLENPGMAAQTGFQELYRTGEYSRVVTYRNGHEVLDTATDTLKKEGKKPGFGLTTNGEFGPILGLVMIDAMHGGFSWLRWEQSAGEPVGVFRYSVPKGRSSYAVQIPTGIKIEELYPAYHGEIAIDPATGEIQRLSVVADMEPPYERIQTAILVEYAPVVIGNRRYICPVKGVAYSRAPVVSAPEPKEGFTATEMTELNDVAFTQYHLFHTEAHIVSGGETNSGPAAPAAAGQNPTPDTAAPGDRGR